MMLIVVWLKGILMGLAIAAPVGPIALLCIRRTLAYGRQIGFVSGCGAATADGLYGMVAAFGLSVVSDALIKYTNYLQIIGGLFLCYLGLKTFLSQASIVQTEVQAEELEGGTRLENQKVVSAYGTTLLLTLTNPATILSFLAIFAGLGITQEAYLNSVTLVFGVFTGSLLWWLVLVSGVAYLRGHLTLERLALFNRWSSRVFGVLILGFGMAALVI